MAISSPHNSSSLGSFSPVEGLQPPSPAFLKESSRPRSSTVESGTSMRSASETTRVSLKRISTDSGSSLHPKTQQHLDRSMSKAMRFHQKRHDLNPELLSGLAQRAVRDVVKDAHSFSNSTVDLQEMVRDPMVQSLDKALSKLKIEPNTDHLTTADTFLEAHNGNETHDALAGMTTGQLKAALEDLKKSFRAVVPVEDVQLTLSSKPDSITQKFQLPAVSPQGLPGFDAGKYEADFLDNMMHSSDEAKESGNAFDLSNETANTGIVSINNEPLVGRSGRTDTDQKVLQILSLNAKAAMEANGGNTENGHGFVDGKFQMVITSAMDLSKQKAAATGGVQFIKNRLADIQDLKNTMTRRVKSQYVALSHKANSNYQSNIKPFDAELNKFKAKYKQVGNNEREQFLQIQQAVDDLFKNAPDGHNITISIPDKNGIPTDVQIAKPLITNMTMSNQAKNGLFTGKKNQNDAVNAQQAYNREHALPTLVQRMSSQLNKDFDSIRSSNILGADDLTRHSTAQEFLSLASAILPKEAKPEHADKLRQKLLKLDNMNSSDPKHLNLVNGLGFMYTQLTKKEFRTNAIQRDRGHEFIQLRSALKTTGMAHSVQCKSGMDRTLTMAALSVAHELNPHGSSKTDGTIHLKQDFSESVAGLGYRACTRNRGPQNKNSKLMKNLKHEPTLRILDMEVYENKIDVLQNQNGAYRDSFG